MICTISKHIAEREGCADAMMLDWRGLVAETTGANVFLVQDGVIHTPDPDCFLDGITRRTVIGLAKARGFKVVERQIKPEELKKTQEIFICGTAAEVTPIQSIGDQKFKPGEITKALMQDYDALVRGQGTKAAKAAE
jgi:branched-chain amino acid aminotransferase